MTEDIIDKEKDEKELPTPVEKVNNNYEELKAANDKVEAELLRTEELKAKARLGGQSNAGSAQSTPEQEFEKKGKELGDEIAGAFI